MWQIGDAAGRPTDGSSTRGWTAASTSSSRPSTGRAIGGYALALTACWQYWLRGIEFTGPEG